MKVSVIIPCYNVRNYVEECIDSVYAQTYKNLEVICVDNGSVDDTLSLLNSLKEKYTDLIILTEFQKGAPNARNRGITVSTGEWIQFLDADDILMPEKINHQVTIVNSKKEIDFIAGNSYWQRADGKSVIWHQFSYKPWIDLLRGTLGDTCSNFWRKEFIQKIGGWNVNVASSQEFDLLFRCLQADASFIYDKEPLTIIRERKKNSISNSNIVENALRYIRLRTNVIEYLKEMKLMTDEIKQEYLYILYNKILPIYDVNKEVAGQLSKEYFSGNKVLGLKKVKFVERLICLLFGMNTMVYLKGLVKK